MPVNLLNEIILIITAAFFGGFLARSVNLPPVLGYIVSGIVFGIIGTNIFHSQGFIMGLSQLGIALLLFTLGFEISIENFKKLNKKIFLAGFLQIILSSILFFPMLLIFHFNPQVSILFSILFSFSSTAVVIKLLEERGIINDFPGDVIFIFLLIQDIFVIPIFFLLPLLFAQNGSLSSEFGVFILSTLKTLVAFVVILLVSKFLLPKLMNILFRYPSHELNILATIFIASISIGVLTFIGLPQTIAAFLAGVLISEEGKNLAPLSEIRPLRDIFLVLFFVMSGMLLDFNFLIGNIQVILPFTIGLLVLKFFIIYILLRFFGFIPQSAVFIAVFLSNVGEFSAIIGQIAFLSGNIDNQAYNFLLSVFILSLILIPFWIKYFRIFAESASKLKLLKFILGEESYLLKNGRAKELSDHVVICGHGRVGKQIRTLLDLAGIPYLVIDFNKKVITELLSLNKSAIYGDPSDDEVLKFSSMDRARVLVVAVPDMLSQKKIIKSALETNPKILIICRAHNEEDRYELVNSGVNSIIIPEIEAGVKIGREVLDIFGINEQASITLINKLRKEFLF